MHQTPNIINLAISQLFSLLQLYRTQTLFKLLHIILTDAMITIR